jgi:hypothetical protein
MYALLLILFDNNLVIVLRDSLSPYFQEIIHQSELIQLFVSTVARLSDVACVLAVSVSTAGSGEDSAL